MAGRYIWGGISGWGGVRWGNSGEDILGVRFLHDTFLFIAISLQRIVQRFMHLMDSPPVHIICHDTLRYITFYVVFSLILTRKLLNASNRI